MTGRIGRPAFGVLLFGSGGSGGEPAAHPAQLPGTGPRLDSTIRSVKQEDRHEHTEKYQVSHNTPLSVELSPDALQAT